VIGPNRDERREIDGGVPIPRATDDDGETARSLTAAGTD
jgi:hypothetical protein